MKELKHITVSSRSKKQLEKIVSTAQEKGDIIRTQNGIVEMLIEKEYGRRFNKSKVV